jgi:hypothetical protein
LNQRSCRRLRKGIVCAPLHPVVDVHWNPVIANLEQWLVVEDAVIGRAVGGSGRLVCSVSCEVCCL